MKDSFEVYGSSILGNGKQRIYATANGVFTPDFTTPMLPQPRTFDEWALMYEFYQVTHIHTNFSPYKWEAAVSTTGVNKCNARPTYSIIDPCVDSPTTPSGFYSYGNCHRTKAYAENIRELDYTNLCLQKQSKTMLRTNGSHANRELYDDPVSISYYMQCPSFTEDTIGELEFFYSITFSGLVGPGLEQPQ